MSGLCSSTVSLPIFLPGECMAFTHKVGFPQTSLTLVCQPCLIYSNPNHREVLSGVTLSQLKVIFIEGNINNK